MQSEEEKEFALMKRKDSANTELNEFSARISALEKHTPRKWESSMVGMSLGIMTGEAISLIPQKWVDNNQVINKNLMRAGKYDESKIILFSTIVGTFTGAIIDLFRFKHRETEYLKEVENLKKQAKALESRQSEISR